MKIKEGTLSFTHISMQVENKGDVDEWAKELKGIYSKYEQLYYALLYNGVTFGMELGDEIVEVIAQGEKTSDQKGVMASVKELLEVVSSKEVLLAQVVQLALPALHQEKAGESARAPSRRTSGLGLFNPLTTLSSSTPAPADLEHIVTFINYHLLRYNLKMSLEMGHALYPLRWKGVCWLSFSPPGEALHHGHLYPAHSLPKGGAESARQRDSES